MDGSFFLKAILVMQISHPRKALADLDRPHFEIYLARKGPHPLQPHYKKTTLTEFLYFPFLG